MRFSYLGILCVALWGCAEGGSGGADLGTAPRDLGPVNDSFVVDEDGADPADDGGPLDAGETPPCSLDAECNDGIECTQDRCDPTDGCVNLADDTFCDDDLVCNGTEICNAEAEVGTRGCVDGTAVDCDDGDACSTDVCEEPAGTCTHSGSDTDGDGEPAIGCGAGMDCDDTDPAVNPGATESCNGVDDDCSGGPDDGFTCTMGSTASCTTACGSSGTLTCTSRCDGFGTCVGAEVCNGCDDDGVAGPDDTFPCIQGASEPCTTACGAPGTHTCNATCTGYGSCLGSEVCGNGCDDDGDGMTDEDCAVPPTNDTCATAIALTPLTGTLTGSFENATGTVSGCGTGGEIWYTITVPDRRVAYFDTFGSTFDTLISVRSGCGGAQLFCDDDHCGTTQSRSVVILGAGTHHIAVHGDGASTGTVSLRWQTFAAGGGNHYNVTTNGTFSGSTSGDSNVLNASCTNASGPEDMFLITRCPGQSSSVTASTCSGTSYDTVLSIVGTTGQLACNDDACGLQSTTSATMTGPGIYGIVVDGWGGSSGSYDVSISGL